MYWDAKTLTLGGGAGRAPGLAGHLFLYVPDGYRPASAAHRVEGHLLKVPLAFDQVEKPWSVKFARGR